MDAKRSSSAKFADWMTSRFGTVWFLLFNGAVFGAWLLINSGQLPVVPVFDEPPFVLLTTIVSLEAIFLAIIVLISENRAARVADIREEIDLQVNLIAEEEITKILELLVLSLKKQGIDISKDLDPHMLEPIHSAEIESRLEDQIK